MKEGRKVEKKIEREKGKRKQLKSSKVSCQRRKRKERKGRKVQIGEERGGR